MAVTVTHCDGREDTEVRYPPPPPPTMSVRLVADIQNRLFWRVGTGRASECCVPSAGWSQASRDWAAMYRLSSACRALILCVAADRGLNRGDFPEPAEGADVWFEPTQGQPTVFKSVRNSVPAVLLPGLQRPCPPCHPRSSRVCPARSQLLCTAPPATGYQPGNRRRLGCNVA